jgi:hypothetical protein
MALSQGHLQGLAGDPAGLGDLVPALGKGAVHEVQNLLFHAVPHRGLHHARGGRGEDENRLLGVQELFELRLELGIELAELRGAVVDLRSSHGLKDLRSNLNRPGNKKLHMGFAHSSSFTPDLAQRKPHVKPKAFCAGRPFTLAIFP